MIATAQSTSQIERNILSRIAQSWSREKDSAQRMGLECEIQFQLGCSWGRSLSLANEIRCQWQEV